MEDMKVSANGYDFEPAHAAMQRLVDGNILSGVSSAVLVGRDLVDVNCAGWADKETQTPLRVDHIFRVFSNTKLVTSCAALLLVEEGRLRLDDPIEKFIPQLANRRVLRPGAASLDETEPARGSISIGHLMSHSSGLSYGFFDPGTVIFKAYNERRVHDPRTTLAEMVDVLADLPLIYQPGTSWEYSVATDVLARLVEVISGQPFDQFIQARILGPLGMTSAIDLAEKSMAPSDADIPYGTLDLMVLKTLDAMGPLHGYGIARRIEQVVQGMLALNQGTIYPALLRLEQKGWITSQWGTSENNRKARFYAITRAGKKQLSAEADSWARTVAIMTRLLEHKP